MKRTQDNQEIFDRLREKGMRVTQSREVLINYILSQSGHWTIQDLAERAQKRFKNIGIATIYRTVNLLLDEEFLTKTLTEEGIARFEITPQDHHDHLTCSHCGLILEFENTKIEALQVRVAQQLGFRLTDHRMELFGACKEYEAKGKCTRRK